MTDVNYSGIELSTQILHSAVYNRITEETLPRLVVAAIPVSLPTGRETLEDYRKGEAHPELRSDLRDSLRYFVGKKVDTIPTTNTQKTSPCSVNLGNFVGIPTPLLPAFKIPDHTSMDPLCKDLIKLSVLLKGRSFKSPYAMGRSEEVNEYVEAAISKLRVLFTSTSST